MTALVNANANLANDLSFDGGIDVHVSGTGFLSAGSAVNPVSALFALTADVTVEVGNAALGEILALGSQSARDDAFDNLVGKLQAAGVDNLEFSVGQIEALAAAGVDFDAGAALGVVVQGTSFLSSNPAISALFNSTDQSTVTVRLNDAQVDGFLANDSPFGSTLAGLDEAGVDAVEIDVGQALQLSDANFDFSEHPGLDVVVQGTHFLDNGLSNGSDLFPDGGSTAYGLWPGAVNTPPLPELPTPVVASGFTEDAQPFGMMRASLPAEDLEASVTGTTEASVDMAFEPVTGQVTVAVEAEVDVISAVDQMVDTMASAAYVDIVSTDELAQALLDVGLGSGVVADNPLADLMAMLAAAPSAANPLQAHALPQAGSAGLAEGLAAGVVADAGDLASLLDPAALDSPHHDVALPTAEDATALLATLAGQQGGSQVQVLGGMEPAATDPFDPFNQHGKT